MVTIKEISQTKKGMDCLKYIFGNRFLIGVKGKKIKDSYHIIPSANPNLFFEELSEDLYLIRIYGMLHQYFRKRHLMSDEDETEFLKILNEYRKEIYERYRADKNILIIKEYLHFTPRDHVIVNSDVSIEILNQYERRAIASAKIKADARYRQITEKLNKLIKNCNFKGCDRIYLAKRSHSCFCDEHRIIGNVHKYRKNHPKKPLDAITCKYERCKKPFIPKTKREQYFCSDLCRVRASKAKNN